MAWKTPLYEDVSLGIPPGVDVLDVGKLNFRDATTLTISSGAITITRSLHYVDTEAGAATDDLTTINGGAEGDVLWLRAADPARTVVIKHGIGNIVTPDGNDYSLDSTDKVVQLIYDGTVWHLVGAAGGGVGTPGGTDGQIQYNDGGTLGGASGLYWDDVNSRFGIHSSSPQTDVVIGAGKEFAIEMSPPSNVTASTAAGGTLSGTYYYKVSAGDGTGWTVLSAEVSATVDGGTTAGTITISWDAVPGASVYRVWRGTSSGEQSEYYETSSISLDDDGSLAWTAGTPPSVTDAFLFRMNANNLGIGIGVLPQYPLHIKWPGWIEAFVVEKPDDTNATFELSNNDNNGTWRWQFSNRYSAEGHQFRFARYDPVEGTWYPPMVINPGGEVGIGTKTPSSLLDVNGTAHLRGSVGATGLYVGTNLGWGTTSPQADFTIAAGKTFAIEMSAPTGVTATTSAGGTLDGTYYYKVSAGDGTGWTVLSAEVSATVDGGTTAGTITISWDAVPGASVYRVWRGTSSGGQNEYYQTSDLSLSDDGSLTWTTGSPPTATTAYGAKLNPAGGHNRLGGPFLFFFKSQETAATTISNTFNININPTESSGAYVRALNLWAQTGTGNPYDFTGYLTGFWQAVRHEGTGTLSALYGIRNQPQNISSGTVTNMYGFYLYAFNKDAAGTISTYYGFYHQPPYNVGTITTGYGIYEASKLRNYFSGNTGIGTTTPTHLLHVAGDIRIDGTTSTTATAGSATLPSNPVGFLTINIGGTDYKVPYYGV